MSATSARDRVAVLEQRARELAKRIEATGPDDVWGTFVVLRVADDSFGIAAETLREIVPLPRVAPLPRTPAWLPGVIQLRGEAISVVDLARWFQVPGATSPRFVAVIAGTTGPLGLMVDEVLDVREVRREELAESFSSSQQSQGRPVAAVTRDLVSLLDHDRLTTHGDLIVRQTALAENADA